MLQSKVDSRQINIVVTPLIVLCYEMQIGGTMALWLVCWTPHWANRVQALAGVFVVLMLFLINAEGNPAVDKHPIQGQ